MSDVRHALACVTMSLKVESASQLLTDKLSLPGKQKHVVHLDYVIAGYFDSRIS